MIRKRRKVKEPYRDLLEALYGIAVLIDFDRSLRVDIGGDHQITAFVALVDLQSKSIDYQQIGYEYLNSPLKTDRKWFAEILGDPVQHKSVEEYFSKARQNAISRSSWKKLSSENSTNRAVGEDAVTMYEWLRKKAEFEIRWHKQMLVEAERHAAKAPRKKVSIERAIDATQVPFVVADLETTGLSANQHEITEVAAILVNPDGTVTSEFSALVKTVNPIPSRITELTGIDDNLVRTEGRHLKSVLEEFLSHTTGRPIFFHHAPFDQGFLNAACEAHGLRLDNEIYDTLPIARKAWPTLGQYKLGTLTEFLELNQPNHRALQDAKAALAVLLASRDTLDL